MKWPKPNPHLIHPKPICFAIGVGCIALRSLLLALMGVIGKIAIETLSVNLVTFYQYLFAFVLISPFALRRGFHLIKTPHPFLQFLRAVLGFLTFYLFYFSLRSTPLVNVMVLLNAAPLYIPLVIWIFFRRKVNKTLALALVVGFIGIILILHPAGGDFLQLSALPALISGITASMMLVLVRRLGKTHSFETTLFYYFAISTVLIGIILTVTGGWVLPQGMQWLLLAAMGLCLALQQLFIVTAVAYAPVSKLSPFLYLAILFAGIFGWVLWDEVPDALAWFGMFLVVGGAISSVVLGKPPSVPTSDRQKKK